MSSLGFWGAFLPAAASGITAAASAKAGGAGGAGKAGAAAQGPSWIDRLLASGQQPTQLGGPGWEPGTPVPPAELPQGTETQGTESTLRKLLQALSVGQQAYGAGKRAPAVYSSRAAKTDIKKETRSLRQIMTTPAVTYRYKDEPKSVPKRPGIIAEQAPKSWRTGPGGNMIKSPAWIGALHGATQNLARRVDKLEKK